MDYRDFKNLNNTKTYREHFWYKARRLLINNLLIEALPQNISDRQIIEIGCGTGTQLSILNKFGQVSGLDIIPESIDLVKKAGFNGQVFDIEKDSLPEASVDVIACFDVLEHLHDDDLVINKISDALKNNGVFLFSVPAAPWLFSSHDKALGHYRRYRKQEIINKIEANNLQIKKINYWNAWLFPLTVIIRLSKKIFNPKKINESDTKPLPRLLNFLLYKILKTETDFIKNGPQLPWGLSIYGYAIKK